MSWYNAESDPHVEVHKTLEAISTSQVERVGRANYWLSAYGENITENYGFSAVTTMDGDEPIPLNIIASVVDAWVPKLAKAKIHIMHLPVVSGSGAAYSAMRTARERGDFLEGVFADTKFRRTALKAAFDAAITGTGCIKCFHNGNRLLLERVWVEELWVDPEDAKYGDPDCVYHRRDISRGALVEMFPDNEDDIMDAPMKGGVRPVTFGADAADMVTVTEAWHRNTSVDDEETNGRHIICLETATLLDEPLDSRRLPISFLSVAPSLRGFFGRGLAERLFPYQYQITELMDLIMENVKAHASPITWVERGAAVDLDTFTDEVGIIGEYTGRAPSRVAAAIVPPEVYSLVADLSRRAFAEVGLSELGSHGEIPRGMSDASGVALRTMTDIESGRHVLAGLEWEDFHLDVGESVLNTAERLAEENPDFYSTYVGQKDGAWFAKKMRWSDVSDGKTEFVLRAFPTAFYPESPPARLAMLSELMSQGFITQEDAIANLELPGTNELLRQRTAGRNMIAKIIEEMVELGKYTKPEPFFPLEQAFVMASDAYALAMADDVSEGRLRLLRDFMSDCKQMLVGKEPPAPPPGLDAGPPMPGAGPTEPPIPGTPA